MKSEFLKVRIKPGNTGASRCNLLLTLVLTKLLFYAEKLCYTLSWTLKNMKFITIFAITSK